MKDTYFIMINNENIDDSELYSHRSKQWAWFFHHAIYPFRYQNIYHDFNDTGRDSQI